MNPAGVETANAQCSFGSQSPSKWTSGPHQPDGGETLQNLHADGAEVGLLQGQGKPDASGEGEGWVAAGGCEWLNE